MGTDDHLIENELDAAGEERLYRAMRQCWHAVMYAADLGDGPQRVELLGEQLVVVRLGGTVRCFPDLCVHRGTALSLGWVTGDQLQCAYHGWTYGPDGVCTAIPARFGIRIPSRARLHPYLVEERDGLVWVCLEPDPAFPIPSLGETGDPDLHVVRGPVYEWRTGAHRRLENFVDFAHFPWVHEGILGTRDEPEVPDHDVTRDGDTLRFQRRTMEVVDGLRFGGSNAQPERLPIVYDYVLSMPLTIRLERRFLGDRRYVLFMTASPAGRSLTRSFWFQARNYGLDRPDEEFLEFEAAVLNQDQPVVESQRPEMLPVDLSAELHIRGADKVSVEYRKWLIELTRRLSPGGST